MDKIVKLLEKFISTLDLDNVCETWVDEEPDEDGKYWVYMVLDKGWYGWTFIDISSLTLK